ncbi:L,D-transpeptidase family protein [Cellulomonas marina]|uniref:L,D-transpeptidase catalytic domain n=1 Tax=Cellulomonas marina TaxID=988821 RepID=A0A1I0YBG4_9CELL|nr:L,D-transpeptidase family protein [Cellulomonas marina]GIG29642.1 hypothetical protein Cma02nite_22420 [Cellulomonas marina]SFB10689.1 L,D-transpeptidase catalytic domain [Cellulomonas marina]
MTAGTGDGHGRGSRRRGPVAAVRAATAALLGITLLAGCTTGTDADPGAAGPAPTATPSARPSSAPPGDRPTGSPSPDASTAPSGSPSTSPVPSPSATPSLTPAPSPSGTPTPSATPSPEPTAPAEPAPLRRGDEGDAVRVLQARLVELGYAVAEPDGRFGSATQQAVWALQKAAGISRDGLVGPQTQAALDAGTRPTARTTSGRVIEVDLDRQLVLAVDGGVVTRVINASSGNGESYEAAGRPQRAYTPTGEYTVVREVDGLRESSLELGTLYRPKYFRAGWAVHGSDSVPPWPASHGCVRVANSAMDWIWDTWGAPIGTPVVVY